MPIAMVLTASPFHSYARRSLPTPFYGSQADWLAVGLQLGLALAAVVVAVKVSRRASRAHPGLRNPAALPLGLGVSVALPFALLSAVAFFLMTVVSSNEHAAAQLQRALMDAQRSYAAVNGGFYDTLGCLSNPASCLGEAKQLRSPLPEGSGSCIHDPSAECFVRYGYQHRWIAGPAAGPDAIGRLGASPTSVVAGAWLSRPVAPGMTGNWQFCVDSSGHTCSVRGAQPELDAAGGSCPSDCPRSLR